MTENERSAFPLNSLEEIKDFEDLDLSGIIVCGYLFKKVSNKIFVCKQIEIVFLIKKMI